jgi:O-antigen/teichoic acid export membrane protein
MLQGGNRAFSRLSPMSAILSKPTQTAATGGAGLYFAAALFAQASGLLRYVALARLLGPHELGLAAALALTGGFFEMVTDTGSDRFLIQDRDGDLPRVQNLVQLVYVARGVAVAALLVAGALPIAWIYGAPRLAPGIALLALSPLIGGLLHLDIRRAQRQHDFRREAICTSAADAAGLLCTVAAALALRSYIAVAIGFVARAACLVIMSHLRASRSYALGYDRAHAPRLARFAAPLMLNGVLLFLVSQGDRAVIGNQLGVTALGYFTAVLLPVYYPSMVIGNTVHGLFLPRIAGHRDDHASRDREIDKFGGLTVFLGFAMAAGYVVVAPVAVPLLFGHRFAQPATLIGLIALMQATRFLLGWPSTTALALGRSHTVLLANLSHIAIVPGAAIGLWLIGGLSGAVSGLLGAEFGALIVALLLMNNATGRPWTSGWSMPALLLLIGAAIEIYGLAFDRHHPALALAMLAALCGLLAWIASRNREALLSLAAVLRNKL